jgi:hypothetical protein
MALGPFRLSIAVTMGVAGSIASTVAVTGPARADPSKAPPGVRVAVTGPVPDLHPAPTADSIGRGVRMPEHESRGRFGSPRLAAQRAAYRECPRSSGRFARAHRRSTATPR